MSLYFYGYFNPKYLWIILISILFNFAVYRILGRISLSASRKIFLVLAVLFNLGILFYFKYFDFYLENVNALFRTNFVLKKLVLPLGISFFTFQQLSFVIDAYKGKVPKYDLICYASFVTFFPQLIAGPIVTHDELVPQFFNHDKKAFSWEHFSQGVYLFQIGLSKKVLIADVFGNAVNWGFSNIDKLDSTNAILTVLAYTIQIYFDFSGYCDMASGVGRMMNLELPVNFDSPYKALTIIEFWERWHITLTRFFTRYIYIPF
jgi:alginate O-acetyltransferase complex protein AlgI